MLQIEISSNRNDNSYEIIWKIPGAVADFRDSESIVAQEFRFVSFFSFHLMVPYVPRYAPMKAAAM